MLELKNRIRQCDEERHTAQTQYDRCTNDQLLLSTDLRDDFTSVMESLQAKIVAALERREDFDTRKAEAVRELQPLEHDYRKSWQQVYHLSQAFADECFEAAFDADWCIRTFSPLLKLIRNLRLHEDMQRSRRNLNEQRVKRALMKVKRPNIDTAVPFVPSILPGPLRHELGTARQDRFDADMTAIDASIERLRDIVEMQSRHLTEVEQELINNVFVPWLSDRHLYGQDSGSIDGAPTAAVIDAEAPSKRSAQETGDSEGDLNTEDELPSSRDQLLVQYRALQTHLVNLQTTITQTIAYERRNAPGYYLAFRNATPEKLEELINRMVSSEREDAELAENRMLANRQQLVDLGIPLTGLSRSPPRRSPTGGGLIQPPAAPGSSQPAMDDDKRSDRAVEVVPRSQRLSRVIDYRLDASRTQDQPRDYAKTAATPPPDVDLTGIGSSAGMDESLQDSPSRSSSGRKRKMVDHDAALSRKNEDVNNARKKQRSDIVARSEGQEGVVEASAESPAGRVTRARTKRDNTRLLEDIR
ncbi:hypothetical protein CKM354_001232900 [Cercospora kikuchii]|uniref:Uncharacterized protein n=1 Tax=Cercospora kikuchii TaxID=84275 RepID=A0A9P3FLS5_9PEZI|nr:uncharacterized protein CKM354_001232900 [Cercospora kikuchii]GIZ49297.1 hypothetical protein CKM354_001232900 [Cercospora kikuchii]